MIVTDVAWARFDDPLSREMMRLSDVVSFHGYAARPELEAKATTCAGFGRPVSCTEWLRRQAGNTFAMALPLFCKHGVGCYHRGLVAGRTQICPP